MALFRNKEVLDHLASVLFIWAKENPMYKYQQGMNELLGNIVVMLHNEYFEDFQKYESDMLDEGASFVQNYQTFVQMH